jgi:tetratricopeptide (TPR) repeat protein
MKIKKEALFGLLFILAVCVGFIWLNMYQSGKSRNDLAVRIAGLGANASPSTIEELKTAIAMYEKKIEAHVKDAAQTGIYWKILASRFQDRGLHNEALKALEQAIYYTPENQVLHYQTGLSAAAAAKANHDFPGTENRERARLFSLAEKSYLRAIELDERYLNPRYGLGVLYVFEFDRPEEAVPHLEKYLEISKSDVDAMFILARAYFMIENFEAAVDLYDRIIGITRDETKRHEAQNNRFSAMERLYG